MTRRHTRELASYLGIVVLLIGGVAASLMLGRGGLSLADLVDLIAGDANRRQLLTLQWRAPRALAAVVFGACLGISGALFSALTRNALGSPDVIGINSGAFTGVIVVIMAGGTGYAITAVGALVGCVVAALLIFLLAYRDGLSGFRLIIIGIAVSAMLSSVNQWFSVRAALDEAMTAAIWGAGTLASITWPPLAATTAVAAVVGLALPFLGWGMRAFELGDDSSAALGISVERTKIGMVVVGVVYTAIVTAVTGPIAFVALAAPQIAKRITGNPSISLVGSACVGAVLLMSGDLTAQYLLGDVKPPVGAVTVVLGGGYLLWLLLRERRR